MKLKLTLHRGGGRPPADLLVAVDAGATVGALANYLAKADPEPGLGAHPASTLVLGPSRSALAPSMLLAESGLRSGMTIALEAVDTATTGPTAVAAAALVRVISGPDQGREFPVGIGTSVIGRDRGCEVHLSDRLISRQHAKLHISDIAEISDLGSSNGLVVNDQSVDRAVLRPGEGVGLGDSVIAVNVLRPSSDAVQSTAVAFNRPPRVDPRFPGVEFEAPEPPEPPRTQRFPILPLFAPLIMGLVIYLSTHAVASLVFVAMSPLLIVANATEARLAGRKAYAKELELFRADITDLVAEATAVAEEEVVRRRNEHPSTVSCMEAAQSLAPLLWSRFPDLPGFLELRLGLGRQPSRSRIVLPHGKQNNRAIWRELRQAVAPFATVEPVPVVADLAEVGAVGVGGAREPSSAMARSLLIQLACLHSPAEVVFAGIVSAQRVADWDWMKWLPHCLSPQSPLGAPPLASSDGACAALIAELENLISARYGEGGQPGKAPPLPRVLVVLDDDAPVDRARAVALAQRGSPVGVHVLWVASDVTRLPAVCRIFLDAGSALGPPAGGFVHRGELVLPLELEPIALAEATGVARILSPVVDAAAREDVQSDLPRTVSFLSLAGLDLAHSTRAVIERWTESRSITSGQHATSSETRRPATLRALVGQSAFGPHVLDLRSQGPHALVGGTTGSGKSELLQSWILAMAVAHSPQRVTFLLVDYKGGSAFSDCVELPHTVGLVTDLSQHLVRRALVSLSAELRNRERILHSKGAKDLLELERLGDPEAPPSLVIVVDEFAALVKEVPEFVEGVVDVAQRGRSLGLHLILATQRPAGVIKDNLRANTNLRLALRVADEADSTDVLGSPDAAGFSPDLPGRAVSRSGPQQLVPFQAAYVGGWTGEHPAEPEITVDSLTFGPSQAWEPPQAPPIPAAELGPTDIQRLVRTIRATSTEAQLPSPRLPWLPALAASYDLSRLPTARRDDTLVFGVLDDPDRQAQPTVAFRPDEEGNLAVFGTGNSGKTVLLRTLAIASGFTIRGGPCHVYGLDFGARGLQILEELPHVGSVIIGSDHERLTRLLGMLRATIDERALRYAKVNAGTISHYRQLAGKTHEPRIFLLVDGVGAFRSAYEAGEHSRWWETFLSIAAEGRPVGIHVILSADRPGAVPAALASVVHRRVVMRLADSNDYSLLGLPNDVLTTSSPPGRGMLEGSELQVAVLGGTPDVLEQANAVRLFAAAMRKQTAVPEAPPISRLPEVVSVTELPSRVGSNPVLGVSGLTLSAMGFDTHGTFIVTGPPGSGRTTTLAAMATMLQRWNPDARLFYIGNRRSPLVSLPLWEKYALGPEEASELAGKLPDLLGENLNGGTNAALFIENIADFLGGPADIALQDVLKRFIADGHLVVAEGETSSLNGSYPLLVAARSGRTGIVLQPDQLDGNLLRATFPRVRRSDFPPGRGLFVSRGATPVVVQVVLPE